MIKSICTIVNKRSLKDFLLLKKSIDIFNPNVVTYVAADAYVTEYFKGPQVNFVVRQMVPENLPPRDPTSHVDAYWLELMKVKMDIMDVALDRHENTMFVDADVVFLNPIEGVDPECDVALSPHNIVESQEESYGRYNGGCVYTNHKDFPGWWRDAIPRSTFYEQQCLVLADEVFKVQELPDQHDFGWYRLEHAPSLKERLKRMRLLTRGEDNKILYDGKPLVSIHTHFFEKRNECYDINYIILGLMCENPRYKEIEGLIIQQVFSEDK